MSKTMCYFCKLIVIENFFCINRNHLIENNFKMKISNYISVITTFFLISTLIYDIVTNLDLYLRGFEFVLFIELLDLSLVAKFRINSFVAIERLDMKCGMGDEYFKEATKKVATASTITIASVIIDAIGLYLLDMRLPVIVVLVILFSAHDTEFAFFTLLIECINLRLATLKEQHPIPGCRMYRHILTVSSQISEEFTPSILLMTGITLFTTVIYSFIIFLAEPILMWKMSLYLLWRETKSLSSMWRACAAAAKTEAICSRLAFHLASQLALDPTVIKEKNLKLHKTVRRWYATVLSVRPCYVSRSLLTISLGMPLIIIDTSINYMIIIVQIYLAYK